MRKKSKSRRDHQSLLQYGAESAEATRTNLHHALDRFERGELLNLPRGSKLTLRNLGLEAGVDKNTPISRYKKPHAKAGEYRFADVVGRFNKLKAEAVTQKPSDHPKDEKIRELRRIIKSKDEENLLLARANNLLDAENYELKAEIRELKEEVIRLRQESIKAVPVGKTRK